MICKELRILLFIKILINDLLCALRDSIASVRAKSNRAKHV